MNKEKKTRSKRGTAAQDPFDDDPMDVDATGLNLPTTIEDTLERYAIVYGTSTTIWDRLHRIPMRPADLRNVIDKALHKEFMNHPLKTVIRPEDVVFDPSQECAGHCVNLYQGLRIRAKAGDCTQILELLRHLLSASSKHEDEVEANIEWVLNWIALPLQKPGTKLSTAVVMHGPQGTGKSMFWEIVLKIYGEYGKVGGQQQLESKYNDWISRTLFAVMEEVVATGELIHYKNMLKSLVTAEHLLIESKFQAVRKERNCCNLVFLSNEARPLAIEHDDRRHAVFWVAPKRTDGLYNRVAHSIKFGALEAFYDFLLKRDLNGFNAYTLPPMTGAKQDLMELGLKPAERFARDWLARQLELPLWACSTGQLYKAFQRWSRQQGERTIVNQNGFTATVSKFARDQLSKLKCSPSKGNPGAPVTLWLPEGTGPLNGVTNFEFATEAVAAFEGPLSRFGQSFSEVAP